jgi:hypothetical protein
MNSKAALQAFLDKEKERFITVYGGEIVRHASPEQVDRVSAATGGRRTKAKVGIAFPALLKGNNTEEQYMHFLEEVQTGTYTASLDPEYVPKGDSRRLRPKPLGPPILVAKPRDKSASVSAREYAESWFR